MNNSAQHPIQTTLHLLFVGLLIWGSFWVLQPFLLALIWATIVVVATWPLLLGLQSKLWNKRGLAVAVMIPASLLWLIVPLTLAVVMIVNHSSDIVEGSKSLVALATAPPPQWVEGIPMIGPKIAVEWRKLAAGGPEAMTPQILPVVDSIVAWFASKAGGVGTMIVQLVLTSIFAAILYLNGDTAAEGVRRFARRFDGARGEDTRQLVVQAIRGVALGVVGTAFIQSAFAGIGLAITGVPYAAMLTGVMLVSAVAQIGTMPVLIPAVIWIYWSGHPGWGTFLLVWTVVAGTLDNFLSPVLIKKGLDLPVLLITAGVMGGLITFGALGLFVGPVVLAVSYTWLVAWIQGDEPEHGPGPAPA